jgi:aspartyl-tRNA synthetase
MTKKLEDFFNIENVETDRDELETQDRLPITETVDMETSLIVMKEQLSIAERINTALPQVRGLDVEDSDLDQYASSAMESYEKLMDLGFNMDDRNAGKIFEVASSMMGNAITAKTAKLEKKLKMIELQLKAAKLEKDLGKNEEETDRVELSTDRNAILNLISQNLKKNDK